MSVSLRKIFLHNWFIYVSYLRYPPLVSTMHRDCELSKSLISTISRDRSSDIGKLAEASVRMVFRFASFQSLCNVWMISKLGLCGFLSLFRVWSVFIGIGFVWFVFEFKVETGKSRYYLQRTFNLLFLSIFDSSFKPVSIT